MTATKTTRTRFSRPWILGVAGGTASGKTWLCRFLGERLGEAAAVLSQDDYYKCLGHLPAGKRAETNFDHPEALDHDLFSRHLEELASGRPVETPQYDYTTHARKPETRALFPPNILLVEGMYVLWHGQTRGLLHDSVFVEYPDDLRLIRRIRRDIAERGRTVEFVLGQYEHHARPMHEQHLKPTARHARKVWKPLDEPGYPGALAEEIRLKWKSEPH